MKYAILTILLSLFAQSTLAETMAVGSGSSSQEASPESVNRAFSRDGHWRTVKAVFCKSGATLNPAETISSGTMVMTTAPAHSKQEFEITSDGSEMISGAGPCPKGDVLVVQFE
jgi:hypothetical protein